MLAVCMSLVLVLVGSFFGGSFPPSGYLRVCLSPTSCLLLCRCGQVVLELLPLCIQGVEAFLLLFFSCLFLVISSLFICIFKYVLGGLSVASPPSFTFFSSYLLVFPLLVSFLFQDVSWCSRLLPTLFYGRPSQGYGCACRAFLDSHSPLFLWSHFTPR